MRASNPRSWMWSEAIEMLSRAERLHQQLFRLAHPEADLPCWEPPVDVLETEGEVIVFTALPGVDLATVQTTLEEGVLAILGRRILPPELSRATIHRLELPQGWFLRRVPIPPGPYGELQRSSWNSCLVVTLRKEVR